MREVKINEDGRAFVSEKWVRYGNTEYQPQDFTQTLEIKRGQVFERELLSLCRRYLRYIPDHKFDDLELVIRAFRYKILNLKEGES